MQPAWFESHLFTGTGKFAAPEVMVEAIRASGSQLVTLAMKRVDLRQRNDCLLYTSYRNQPVEQHHLLSETQ